ncbi:cryptochrome/photolyase family protein [Gaoshiqia sediminis]|uniref:DNA photolyase family protein n=1 Tax=Gaoshiqia sediminis TaxID=2986998 RepID=A0AA42C9A7_9BACT|nr:deoxyribodipyrimidine photo-lyase [Gaoshiqia sediminis]MCW0482252.1 DNA photolyase family protein [Gaoshiqia sediminis]
MKEQPVTVFWFRRDLRISDNHGLFKALTSGRPVLPVFVFDTDILNDLEDDDSCVSFILRQVQQLQDKFEADGSSFWIYHGKTLDAFKRLVAEYSVERVFINQDYEPYARKRDQEIFEYLGSMGIEMKAFKDQVIFHKNEILNGDGKPYTVFTPYSKRWLAKLSEKDWKPYPSEKYLGNLLKMAPLRKFHHVDIGFRRGSLEIPPQEITPEILTAYKDKRDFPAVDATSRLGVHLRFGTISIRQVTAAAVQYSSAFLNELIWRNFYMDILWHFPQVEKQSFKPAYDHIAWINSEKDFARWCEGTTGFPLVDAGMRQLNQTGFMHNRVRMVTASFLCKHLLIDWRWGEAFFAEKLLDYELASNNGGWQWAAGSGCDAAPYFRVFNPILQQEKFDPELVYVHRWVPEFGTDHYPKPMVDHRMARQRAIDTYRAGLVERAGGEAVKSVKK